MIVDFHTHVFPPDVRERRERYLEGDATFRALYSDAKAKIATADDLLASMDASGIDVSIALGFAWSDAETCRAHNDYLLEAAARSAGRIVPFCTLPLAGGIAAVEAEARRCAGLGAKGFGELRPETTGFDLAGPHGAALAATVAELDTVLLFHVSEPVGHAYAGKEGLPVADYYRFLCSHPGVKAVGAHWGGGLPFYAHMPEVREALSHSYVDTAATSLLYADDLYRRVVEHIGHGAILFGSDYPLLTQSRSRRRIEEASLEPEARDAILGGNAVALLELA